MGTLCPVTLTTAQCRGCCFPPTLKVRRLRLRDVKSLASVAQLLRGRARATLSPPQASRQLHPLPWGDQALPGGRRRADWAPRLPLPTCPAAGTPDFHRNRRPSSRDLQVSGSKAEFGPGLTHLFLGDPLSVQPCDSHSWKHTGCTSSL